MIRMILFFLLIWAGVTGSIYAWYRISNFERFQLTKAIMFGGVTAALSAALVISVVLIF